MKYLTLAAAMAFGLSACSHLEPSSDGTPPKPLFRDPVHDGAADAAVVHDRAAGDWKMFYTNRRATLKLPDNDVSWLHATQIGIASSRDGLAWRYQGTANIPLSCTGDTLWAPEIHEEDGTYHMWLTVVPGVFKNWNAGRFITHLTSKDLKEWTCAERLELGTERGIDAAVIKKDGIYHLWFKDEKKDSRIFHMESADLRNWVRQPEPVVDTNAEGPKVFQFGGHYWMIADVWKGLMVLRSDDLKTWTRQPARILEQPGSQPTDNDKGQHPEVIVNHGRALIYYFVHQYKAPEAAADPKYGQRTVIQVAELKIGADGWLTVDRNAALDARLHAPQRTGQK